MPRWTSLGLLATVTTAACGGGGAHEAVRTRMGTSHNGPVAHVSQRASTPPSASTPGEDAPRLVTITGRSANSPYSIPGVVPPSGGVPASGGYVVRAAGVGGGSGGGYGGSGEVATATAPGTGSSYGAPRGRSSGAEGGGAVTRGGAADRSRSVDDLLVSATGSSRSSGSSGYAASAPATERPAEPSAGRESLRSAPRAPRPVAQNAAPARATAGPVAARPTRSRAAVATGGAAYDAAPTSPAAVATGATTITVPPGSTVAVVPVPPPPPVGAVVVVEEQQAPEGGVLTAASVGDADRRANYLDYLSRHTYEGETLGLDMSRRVRFRVVDAQNRPVNDAAITLAGGNVRTSGRTHADGVWDFYPSVVAPGVAGGFGVHVQVESVGVDTTCEVPAVGDGGDVTVRLPAVITPAPPALDLAFAIDVTGSMGDELAYVNREVASIVQRVQARAPGVRVRVGATFYRDRVDEFVVQQIPFSGNVFGFANAMRGVTAGGGGDYPEDLNAGLEAAITRLTWSEGPAVRVLVVIADAPPQHYPTQFTYRNAMLDASRRGIRILPVGASGADRTVEYLFRAMGAFTSTPYAYLTDDSGVGAPHMEADTDRVGVERFNDLLTRVILADLAGQGMHEPGALGPQG